MDRDGDGTSPLLNDRSRLVRFAWLSVAAAVVTIVMKSAAFLLTGSVGLLSDALESGVNLAGALLAVAMLRVASRPPDAEHAYGHEKAEYFASGVEGTLIAVAAGSIGIAAAGRLLDPAPLERLGTGLPITAAAAAVSLAVALVLRRAGRRHESVALQADAQHLLTDVITSAGVIAAVAAAGLTGRRWLDPAIALLVAAHIAWTGAALVRRSILGLMDTALPSEEQAIVRRLLDRHARDEGVQYHALRTRRSGARRFVSVHVLVPGAWSVQRGHELLERIETGIRDALPRASVFTHLESLEDAASWQDQGLDRGERTGV